MQAVRVRLEWLKPFRLTVAAGWQGAGHSGGSPGLRVRKRKSLPEPGSGQLFERPMMPLIQVATLKRSRFLVYCSGELITSGLTPGLCTA